MWVNPFWFGVLMTIVGFIALMIVLAIVNTLKDDEYEEDYDVDPEEYRQMMEQLTGKKMRVYREHGHLVASPIEDEDDDDSHST